MQRQISDKIQTQIKREEGRGRGAISAFIVRADTMLSAGKFHCGDCFCHLRIAFSIFFITQPCFYFFSFFFFLILDADDKTPWICGSRYI